MKFTLYLNPDTAALLGRIMDVLKSERPSATKPSPVIADALIHYAAFLIQRHTKDHGISPRTQAKLQTLADICKAKGYDLA